MPTLSPWAHKCPLWLRDMPALSQDLAICLHSLMLHARTNLLSLGVFATGLSVTQVDDMLEADVSAWIDQVAHAFESRTPYHPQWNQYGVPVSSPKEKQVFDPADFCASFKRDRFELCWGAVFGHTCPDKSWFENIFRDADEHLRSKASQVSGSELVYTCINKPAGCAMTWHRDVDKRENGNACSDMIVYFIVGRPNEYNRLVVFACNDESDAVSLSRDVDAKHVAIQAPTDSVPTECCSSGRPRLLIPLVPIETPSELKEVVGELDGQAYAMWVRGGDCIIFDGSKLHGIYNTHAQKALAVQGIGSQLTLMPGAQSAGGQGEIGLKQYRRRAHGRLSGVYIQGPSKAAGKQKVAEALPSESPNESQLLDAVLSPQDTPFLPVLAEWSTDGNQDRLKFARALQFLHFSRRSTAESVELDALATFLDTSNLNPIVEPPDGSSSFVLGIKLGADICAAIAIVMMPPTKRGLAKMIVHGIGIHPSLRRRGFGKTLFLAGRTQALGRCDVEHWRGLQIELPNGHCHYTLFALHLYHSLGANEVSFQYDGKVLKLKDWTTRVVALETLEAGVQASLRKKADLDKMQDKMRVIFAPLYSSAPVNESPAHFRALRHYVTQHYSAYSSGSRGGSSSTSSTDQSSSKRPASLGAPGGGSSRA